ncbi:MAG: hypothetical protein HUU28_06490 [Planctomycetaceae bacterium]|nr:hypothetical protein [Planctomycetaceae bacterium]
MTNLAALATALPDTEQGLACAGTSLESRTFHVRRKTFLFLSPTQARLKLATSAAEARKLGIPVGANGWATLQLDALPPAAVLKRWITESHSLVVPARPRKSRK